MFKNIKADIAAIKKRDPAARSAFEIFFLYSGFHALLFHRLASSLYRHKCYFLARWVSQYSRFRTGIEIHPAAQIGRGVFIDHGTGVVIGETAIVGDGCVIYQGVTLGGTGKDTGKRHPTLGKNVMVGAGAKVLGPVEIGADCKIAAGAVVLNTLPHGSTAVGVPARIVRLDGKRTAEPDLDQVHIPDPISQELCKLSARIRSLEKQLESKTND